MTEAEAWIGRTRTFTQRVALAPARALAATLDEDPEALAHGAEIPHGWHWIYFNEPVRRSLLGPDGHEARGGFLPPVPLERRMWAGGRLSFRRPLRIGEELSRTSTVMDVRSKRGRTGPLVFVTVRHRVEGADGPVLEEEQDLVYRGRPSAPAPGEPAPPDARKLDEFEADAVTLFRFSALTFNGHRIHYDHRWATEQEGYPDVVVHGPLVALLLLRAGLRARGGDVGVGGGAAADDESPLAYRYRARAPLFRGERFDLLAREEGKHGLRLWAVHPERGVAMEAALS